MMKVWNVWLIFTTFILTIVGTWLTRSGLVSSVHAFAESAIGSWFAAFLIVVFCVCLFTFFRQKDHLRSENRLQSLVSRESSFLFNNLILLASCFTVLWGTFFPILSEYVQGSKVTVGPPFYNRVMVPIGLGLIFLTGVGPLLAWRANSLRALRRNFVLPCTAVLLTAVVLMIAGVRPWSEDDPTSSIYALVCISLSVGVIIAICAEFLRGANVVRTQTQRNLFSSAILLTRRNTRRYGGYLIHFGIVVMFIGLAGGAFNQSRETEMGFGDSVSIGSWKLVCQSFSQDTNANYDTDYAMMDLYHGSKLVTHLNPERRIYFPDTDHAQSSTVVAIHSTLARDLYVVFEGRNAQTNRPDIKVFLNPLVNWIWIGVGIVILGTAVALTPPLLPGAQRAVAPAGRFARAALPDLGGAERPSVAMSASTPEAGHA